MTADDVKKRLKAAERRFPRVLAVELLQALAAVDALIPDPDERAAMLSRYRRNKVRRIAAWGLEPNDRPVDGLEDIPISCDRVLGDADKRLQMVRESSERTRMNIDTTITVTFRCLAESDADYERMDIRSAPAMVIEDRRR